MEIDIFQIDAFTSELFKGNPACVMPLDNWLPDELLLKIAKENNDTSNIPLPENVGNGIITSDNTEPTEQNKTVPRISMESQEVSGVYITQGCQNR